MADSLLASKFYESADNCGNISTLICLWIRSLMSAPELHLTVGVWFGLVLIGPDLYGLD